MDYWLGTRSYFHQVTPNGLLNRFTGCPSLLGMGAEESTA